MSGCHSTEVKCECLCHGIQWPADYDFSGSVCCGCHKNKITTEIPLTFHPTQILVDKFEDRIKRIEDFHIRNFNERIDSIEESLENYREYKTEIEDLENDTKKRHWLILECEKFESRIESLESQMKASTEMYKELSISIAGLLDHKVRQVDENRKISSRADEITKEIVNQAYIAEKQSIALELRVKKLEDDLKDENRKISSRVGNLEQVLNNEMAMRKDFRDYCFERLGSAINPPSPINVYERIEKLESDHLDKLNPHAFLILKTRCDELETKYNDLLNFKNTAFKKYNLKPHKCPLCDGKGFIIYIVSKDTCKACEGKGIVWG